MSKPQEYRLSAEICLRLARDTRDIYARNGLMELAADFRVIAEEMEGEARHTIRGLSSSSVAKSSISLKLWNDFPLGKVNATRGESLCPALFNIR
jgi:hypothetical protein